MAQDLSSLRRRLAAGGRATGFESAGFENSGAGVDLGTMRSERSLDALSDLIAQARPDPGDEDVTVGLLDAAREGLEALHSGADALPPKMEIALEALVLADGSRPSLLVRDDRIDPGDRTIGQWKADLVGAEHILRDIARGCGRVTLTGDDGAARCIGTAFAVGEGIVATNLHVLQAIASRGCAGEWVFHPGVTIDFRAEHERDPDPARQHEPERVIFAGPDTIGEVVDPALLDLALIGLRENGSRPMPASLQLSEDSGLLRRGGRIAVLGHPAAPARGDYADNVLFRLFRGVFGVKRLAPGLITSGLGDVQGDRAPPRSIGHDASTLGGNSGSCILILDGTWDVVGLHFGGRQQVENLAHAMAVIREDLSCLPAVI